jgi:hypothetical protein
MALEKEKAADYLKLIEERAKQSHVYTKHQLIGLVLAEMLGDEDHKSFYMRLAKDYPENELFSLAGDVAENDQIKNKGAYFMTVWHERIRDIKHK